MPTLTAMVKDGRLVPDGPEGIITLARMNGRRVVCGVEIWRKNRSAAQNRYYRGVVIELISEWSGYTPDEAHEAMRLLFLSKEGKPGVPPTVRSTTDLTTVEFEEYMSRIREWASLHGVYIPQPHEEAA